MKNTILTIILLIITQAVSFGQRDPYLWPFDKESIWNMPIHNDAEYYDIPEGDLPPHGRYGVDDNHILYLDDSYPVTPFYANDGNWSFDRCNNTAGLIDNIHFPPDYIVPDATGGNTPNNNYAFLLSDDTTIYTGNVLARCDEGGPVYGRSWNATSTVYGNGIESNLGQGAASMSSYGGTIRVEDIERGRISHAIKFTLWADEYFFYGSSKSSCYRWPATSCDSYAGDGNHYFGNNPKLVMGILLAIHPSVSIESMNFETSFAPLIFEALQNYGGYAVEDAAWDKFYLIGDQGVKDKVKDLYGVELETGGSETPWKRDMDKILRALQIIDNNYPETIGGGPNSDYTNRRAPMACDFGTVGSGETCPVGLDVSFISPADSSIINSGSDINLVVDVQKKNAGIDSVRFYSNSNLVFTDTTPPYEYNISAPLDGKYKFLARGYDSLGGIGISETHTVWVGNRPPEVSLTAPVQDALIDVNTPIDMQVSASDANGMVSKVLFYVDNIYKGEDDTAPYSLTYNEEIEGEHIGYARAIDNNGDTATSETVSYTVKREYVIGQQQIPNPGFETDSMVWDYLTGSDNGSFEITDRNGNRVLKIVSNMADTDAGWNMMIGNAFYRYIEQGETYQFAFEGSSDSQRDFQLDIRVDDQKVSFEEVMLDTSIQKFKYAFNASNSGSLLIRFMPTQSTEPVRIDNVSFIRGASPEISIESGDTIIDGNTEIITAIVGDFDGYITLVKFYIDNEVVKTDDQEPYTYSFATNKSMIGNATVKVMATDNDGLEHTVSRQIVIVDDLVNVNYVGNNVEYIQVFPNPNSGTFSIRNNTVQDITSVILYDNTGRIVYKSGNITPGEVSMVNKELPEGIYYIQLHSVNQVISKKILVKGQK